MVFVYGFVYSPKLTAMQEIKSKLAHKAIGKYLKDNDIPFISYEDYNCRTNKNPNPNHIIEVVLLDNSKMRIETRFNPSATELFDTMLFICKITIIIGDVENCIYYEPLAELDEILKIVEKESVGFKKDDED